nr:hypothetical protein CFP56_04178 [Quercus suber]
MSGIPTDVLYLIRGIDVPPPRMLHQSQTEKDRRISSLLVMPALDECNNRFVAGRVVTVLCSICLAESSTQTAYTSWRPGPPPERSQARPLPDAVVSGMR